MDKDQLAKEIEVQYPTLAPMLQRAARYILDHPRDVALSSMRALATQAGLQASVMNRLAQRLGFEGYAPLRAVYQDWLGKPSANFAERASALQRGKNSGADQRLSEQFIRADCASLTELLTPETMAAIEAAADTLGNARSIHVIGLRSLFPAAFYFHYACSLFMNNVYLATGTGGVLIDGLRSAGEQDALLVFSHQPYARDALATAAWAHKQQIAIVGVTDSTLSPLAAYSRHLVLAPGSTPSLLPTVVPSLSVAQTLVGLLSAKLGKKTIQAIKRSEAQLQAFRTYASPD